MGSRQFGAEKWSEALWSAHTANAHNPDTHPSGCAMMNSLPLPAGDETEPPAGAGAAGWKGDIHDRKSDGCVRVCELSVVVSRG
jgi:hypothetical protein